MGNVRMGGRALRLTEYLFDTAADRDLAGELAEWLAAEPRYRAFVENHRDKIRKKLRTAAGADARRDVRAELCVAHMLLADPRLELSFEPYGSKRGGPDFTVTFRRHRSFDLEVTRMHRDPAEVTDGGPVLAKLRQLWPGVANVLLVAVEGDSADAFDVSAAIGDLRTRANAKDEDFFRRRGFAGTRAFYDRFLRLGAVLVWSERAPDGLRCAPWGNPSARIRVPDRALRAVTACLEQDHSKPRATRALS